MPAEGRQATRFGNLRFSIWPNPQIRSGREANGAQSPLAHTSGSEAKVVNDNRSPTLCRARSSRLWVYPAPIQFQPPTGLWSKAQGSPVCGATLGNRWASAAIPPYRGHIQNLHPGRGASKSLAAATPSPVDTASIFVGGVPGLILPGPASLPGCPTTSGIASAAQMEPPLSAFCHPSSDFVPARPGLASAIAHAHTQIGCR